jgi:hypothetical protein
MLDAAADLKAYNRAMLASDCSACLTIERRWGLDGYPPEVVTYALGRAVQGENAAHAAAMACGGGGLG